MTTRICSAPDCNLKHSAKGYCKKHHARFMSRNSVEDRQNLPASQSVEARTLKTETCWLWTGSLQTTGYGALQVDGVRKYAHRVVYELANGPIPEGMRIDHICHVKKCVRPDHLRVVTIKQNAENYGGLMPTNTSGARGVFRSAGRSKWQVQVTHDGRRYSGGSHADLADANAAAVALRNRLHTHNDLDRVSA